MKADKFLERLEDTDFEVIEQDNPTLDCDDAARERGVETSQIVKSLILEKDGKRLHVLLPGDRELSEGKFGESRLLPPEESEELTGFESGTVHPFSTELKHIVDERVLEKQRVSFTTGERSRGILMTGDDFREALNKSGFEYAVKDIVVTTERDIDEIEEKGLDREKASFLCEEGYRKLFHELVEKYPAEKVSGAIEKMNRQGTDFGRQDVVKLVEKSEGETHMLKLAEKLAEDGELPDEDGFDTDQVVEEVLDGNSDAVEDYRNGRESALNYLMGSVMEKTNGRAEAPKVKEKLKERLDE